MPEPAANRRLLSSPLPLAAKRRAPLLACLLLLIGPALLPAADCGRDAEDNFDEQRWRVDPGGTVRDAQFGLMWKQCPEGLSGSRCRQGRIAYLTWEQALAVAQRSAFAGFNDWRIPKLNELRELIVPDCLFPAVNLSLFPNTPSGWFWFDSAEAGNSPRAGQLGFAFGEEFSANQRHIVHLRLVRDMTPEPPPEPEPDPEPDQAPPEDAADAEAEDANGAEAQPGEVPEPPAQDAAEAPAN